MAVLPAEGYPVLIIHPHTLPARMVALERLRAVPGRHAQVVQSSGSIQKSQLPRGFKSGRQAQRLLAVHGVVRNLFAVVAPRARQPRATAAFPRFRDVGRRGRGLTLIG